ncbi:glutamate decarboxylase-like protein 1 [Paraphaeosphaeria sporulosa]|uniref:Glutamate decarboxylase-like protein 1 n=1 Tax=Paraphaeosphaeria sporulosa TaxID=1460663 RepID=A0A177C710_9PLEO|nr:glutamate decarboxylase-like protein 1 [Paraphaeosphaeria sporulosa]OAG02652.1 glutamate decarboxylase-like protein 1 [Paraphaeosphaeria sporulosa]
MTGITNGDGAEAPLNRADEVKELLEAVEELIIPFIRSADEDAATKHSGHGLAIRGGGPRTALVEHHPPKKLEQILDLSIPEQAGGKDGLVEIVEKVLRYSVNTWDQGFLDKLYASTNAVCRCRTRLGAAARHAEHECEIALPFPNFCPGKGSEVLINYMQKAHVYQVSPVLTLVEKHTTKHLAHRFGYTSSHAGGISQPGGSASNSSAIVIARNTLYPETKEEGNGDRRFTLFTSAHGHYSLEKAAQMFGLGSKNVIPVPVDGSGKMVPEELERLVKESKGRGETPFFINATAGTTVLGSFDPFPALAAIAKAHNLWLHVDGSWGGSVIFNPEIAKGRLDGVELADSIAVNPHKMLGVPMTSSFLLAKDLRQFWKAMTLPAGYLFHNAGESVDDIYDLADLTPQCGRRADALKFFLSLQYYGEQHYAGVVANAYQQAEYLASLIKASPHFVFVSPDPLPCLQVCFYWARDGKLSGDKEENGRVTSEVAKKLISRGFMIDYAPGEKGKFFRVVVNGSTRRGTVEGLVKGIEECAGELGF